MKMSEELAFKKKLYIYTRNQVNICLIHSHNCVKFVFLSL